VPVVEALAVALVLAARRAVRVEHQPLAESETKPHMNEYAKRNFIFASLARPFGVGLVALAILGRAVDRQALTAHVHGLQRLHEAGRAGV